MGHSVVREKMIVVVESSASALASRLAMSASRSLRIFRADAAATAAWFYACMRLPPVFRPLASTSKKGNRRPSGTRCGSLTKGCRFFGSVCRCRMSCERLRAFLMQSDARPTVMSSFGVERCNVSSVE